MTIENTDSDMKMHALHYANELLVRDRLSFQKPWIVIHAKTFANSLNVQKKEEEMLGKIILKRTCCR